MARTISLRLGLLLVLSVLLAACGGAGAPSAGPAPTGASAGDRPTSLLEATHVPQATVAPAAALATSAPSALPATTAAPAISQPVATAAPEGGIAQGLTPEGYHYLGRDDAPVTITNYSDFL